MTMSLPKKKQRREDEEEKPQETEKHYEEMHDARVDSTSAFPVTGHEVHEEEMHASDEKDGEEEERDEKSKREKDTCDPHHDTCDDVRLHSSPTEDDEMR